MKQTFLTGTYSLIFIAFLFPPAAQDKIVVQSADDLPRHVYRIEGTVEETIRTDEKFDELARRIREDIESDLAKYDIGDKQTLQRYFGVLMNLEMLKEDYEAVLRCYDRIQELEDKEAARLLMGHWVKAYIHAKKDAGHDDSQFRELFRGTLLERLRKLPWDMVGDRIRWLKQDAEGFNENVLWGIVTSRFEPIAAESGEVSAYFARQFITARYMLEIEIPMRADRIAVYEILIRENRTEKEDIWTSRSVTFSPELPLVPVVVAIWDTGLDTSLFAGRLWTNPGEENNGCDDDGNGYVDDVHGIAFDEDGHPAIDLLHPLDHLNASLQEVTRLSKGSKDRADGIDSAEAAEYLRTVENLSAGAFRSFQEDMVLLGVYRHGTHVTGIAAQGNPFIRVLIVRFTGEHRIIPRPPTVEQARAAAQRYASIADYFKAHGVRIVNMSWLNNLSLIENSLEVNGICESAQQRGELARTIYRIERDALHAVIAEAPEILFVTAAGNFDNDVDFSKAYPAGFDLANLLVVGAVDSAGDSTSFTSFGGNVCIYTNGFEVENVVPGGERVKMSGTSMASPQAVNLAAKILAVEPSLRPEEVIALMERGADRRAGESTMLLTHPRRTLALLKKPVCRIIDWTDQAFAFPFPATLMTPKGDEVMADFWIDDKEQLRVVMQGTVELTKDHRALRRLSSDGYLAVRDERSGARLEVDVFCLHDGSVEYAYFLDGTNRPFDDEACRWLGDVLSLCCADKNVALPARIERIVLNFGMDSCLSKLERLEGDPLKVVFYESLIHTVTLKGGDGVEVIRHIGSHVASDRLKADLLLELIPLCRKDQSMHSALEDSVKGIASPDERQRVIDVM